MSSKRWSLNIKSTYNIRIQNFSDKYWIWYRQHWQHYLTTCQILSYVFNSIQLSVYATSISRRQFEGCECSSRRCPLDYVSVVIYITRQTYWGLPVFSYHTKQKHNNYCNWIDITILLIHLYADGTSSNNIVYSMFLRMTNFAYAMSLVFILYLHEQNIRYHDPNILVIICHHIISSWLWC